MRPEKAHELSGVHCLSRLSEIELVKKPEQLLQVRRLCGREREKVAKACGQLEWGWPGGVEILHAPTCRPILNALVDLSDLTPVSTAPATQSKAQLPGTITLGHLALATCAEGVTPHSEGLADPT